MTIEDDLFNSALTICEGHGLPLAQYPKIKRCVDILIAAVAKQKRAEQIRHKPSLPETLYNWVENPVNEGFIPSRELRKYLGIGPLERELYREAVKLLKASGWRTYVRSVAGQQLPGYRKGDIRGVVFLAGPDPTFDFTTFWVARSSRAVQETMAHIAELEAARKLLD